MADVTAVRPATIAAFLLAMVIALPVAQSVYDIPVQHGDVLEPMILGATAPSTAQLFARSLHVATNTLRPLRFVQSRWLLQLSEATGASYHAVFRGVHALLAVVLVLLFVHAAGVRSWLDVAAVSIPLTVLLGMPTLVAVLGEAYPVNHFIEIAIFTLAVLPMAVRPEGGGPRRRRSSCWRTRSSFSSPACWYGWRWSRACSSGYRVSRAGP